MICFSICFFCALLEKLERFNAFEKSPATAFQLVFADPGPSFATFCAKFLTFTTATLPLAVFSKFPKLLSSLQYLPSSLQHHRQLRRR